MANIDDKKIPRGGVETPIVGRLHDVSEDHVVTGANEVFDDAFGERQSQINDKLRHYTKMAHIRIDAEEITREHNDNLLNEEINTKQLEIGAVETDIEPILDSPNMLPSGAIAFNLGYYTEGNHEWLYVITDGAMRVLAGIKRDGSVEWMVGVPTSVKNYVDAHIQELIERLEELEEHILEELEKKVDKEEDKSLINKDYADGITYIENPEFLEVCLDKNGRFLYGVQKDGNFLFGAGVPQQIVDFVKNYTKNIKDFLAGFDGDETLKEYLEENYGKYEENPEFLEVKLDAEGKFLWGIRKDGDIVFGCGIPSEIQNALNKIVKDIDDSFGDIRGTFHYETNPEYIFACVDAEGKFLYGVTVEGKFRAGDLEFDVTKEAKWLNTVFSLIEDPEGRIDATVDANDKLLSWRDAEGKKHETYFKVENSLELSDKAMNAFQQALKDAGFNPGGTGDWSDAKSLEIPMPRCAMVNITAPDGDAVWPQSKGVDLQYYMEFWDMDGNYFKKEIIFNAQGNSSMAFEKKNGAVDICNNNGWNDDDTFSLKIGDWVAQDSFHFKSYHTDFIRGAAVIAYQIADEVYKTRGVFADRPWKKALLPATIPSAVPANLSEDGTDDVSLQIDNGARCMPDGFPAIFYLNGEFYGIFAWQLKKHRDNYHMKKSNANHIQIDGDLYDRNLWGGTINWNSFEVRNPKDLYCMDGTKYDGDNPKELIDDTSEYYDSTNKKHKTTAQVKQAIINLSQRIGEINTLNSTDSAAAKVLFDTYFDADNIIDYQLINMAVNDPDGFGKNWQWITYDGIKWYVCQYDKDMAFGDHHTGMFTRQPSTGGWMNNNTNLPTGLAIRYYNAEHKARWQELVNADIFSTENIANKIRDWVARIGQSNFAKEWEKWSDAPCNRDSGIDYENWRFTGGYSQSAPSGGTIWANNVNYTVGQKVWYHGTDYLEFEAIQANIDKKPLTIIHAVFPTVMGYRDSMWRYIKFIDVNLRNQNTFINNLNV